MLGLMMNRPLLIIDILKHAVRTSPSQEIVTRLVEGGIHRYTFAEASDRIAQLANALKEAGVTVGTRVGVMGWNTHRQLELYYACAGIGAICHTINPRLGPENAAFVINHAEDSVLFFDETFQPLVEGLKPHLKSVDQYYTLAPKPTSVGGEKVGTYEDFISGKPTTFEWEDLDENTACGLCYTSGTTGKPKGVLYSHRGMVLHSLVTSLPTGLGAGDQDCIMPVVPMFHVNAWGVPYSALLMGTKLVLPGAGLDGASLHELIIKEEVTVSLGVPTVWLNLLKHVDDANGDFGKMRFTLVGGAALSERLIEGFGKYGVKTRQGWGMTEMSPTGTMNFEETGFEELPREEQIKRLLRQGRALPFVDMRIVDEEGHDLPHDGEHDGHLQVRGPWILSAYYKQEQECCTTDGWFDTGDVAVIHPDGRMQITDRAKDVIKSGGEWISTIDIENVALSHPAVVQAAAIGMPHPKWQERPVIVVEFGNEAAEKDEILAFMKERLPKISWPDDVLVVDQIPIGATGKVLKTELRKIFSEYKLPTAS